MGREGETHIQALDRGRSQVVGFHWFPTGLHSVNSVERGRWNCGIKKAKNIKRLQLVASVKQGSWGLTDTEPSVMGTARPMLGLLFTGYAWLLCVVSIFIAFGPFSFYLVVSACLDMGVYAWSYFILCHISWCHWGTYSFLGDMVCSGSGWKGSWVGYS